MRRFVKNLNDVYLFINLAKIIYKNLRKNEVTEWGELCRVKNERKR